MGCLNAARKAAGLWLNCQHSAVLLLSGRFSGKLRESLAAEIDEEPRGNGEV